MTSPLRWTSAGLLAALALAACPSTNNNNRGLETRSFEEMCPTLCDNQEDCYGLQGQTMQECVDECVGWRNDDLERMGDTCDTLLFDLRECEYALSCADWDIFLEGGFNDGEPCAAEAQAFHLENDCMSGAD
jgi:hypothetical protein